jgi:hypothetical protein
MSVCQSTGLCWTFNMCNIELWLFEQNVMRLYKGKRNNIMLTSANSFGVVNQASKFIIRDRQFQTEAPWHQRVIEQSEHEARRSDLCRYKQNSFDCHLKNGRRHAWLSWSRHSSFAKCVAIVRAPNLCALLTDCQLLFVLFLVSR